MAKKIDKNLLEGVVAKNLRELRKMYDITQEQLSKISGLPRSTIAKYETGHGVITLENLLILSETFGKEPNVLLKGWRDCL